MTAPVPTVICTGIAVLDQIYDTEALPRGAGKHFARGYREAGGGPAATAAVAIARLGGRAAFWGRVGDDPVGARIADDLADFGVELSGLRRVVGGRSSVSAVVVDAKGERMIVNYGDPDLDRDPAFLPLDRLDAAGAVLADARWPEGAAAALDAARASGLPAVLDADATPDDAARPLLCRASHVVFSTAGLAQATGFDDPQRGLAAARLETDAFLAVTLGGDGCAWLAADGTLARLPAFAVTPVDTLGAGDVFHGAFALALAERRGEREALAFASAAAALKCARPGGRAALPDRRAVDRLLEEAA
jgi:sulfofructose kinase